MKFNTPNKSPIAPTPNTVTFGGAPAYKLDPITDLYVAVATSLMGEPKFYETGDQRSSRIEALINDAVKKGETETVAKLAIYCRESLNLRSVPIFITVMLAKAIRENNVEWKGMRRLSNRVIQRADEIREMFAAAQHVFGDPTNNKVFKRVAPKALMRGIGDAMNKFDEYQFSKYKGGSGSVSFKDVLRVVHPKPATPEIGDLFAKIMSDSLKPAETWENLISNSGSSTDNWQSVANDSKVGLMAKLRNLRNFVKHKVDLTNVINHLTNEKAIVNSKQLPFRWYTAYRELGGETMKRQSLYSYRQDSDAVVAPAKLLTALEDAFDKSIQNLPDLGDDVLIVVDQSGSMQSPVSDKSTVMCSEIAAVLATAVWYNQTRRGKNAMVAGFACRGKVYNNWSTRTSALSAARDMMNTNLGGSTRIETSWDAARKAKLKPSTIIVLSDMQMTGNHYSNIMNPEDYGLADKDTLKISVNLQGYSTTPFASQNGWYQLTGWSDKLFDLVDSIKNPSGALNIIRNSITL